MRFLAILLSASLMLGAQKSPGPPPEPVRGDVVFSVTSTLVQIDAVVLDDKGRQVTNLGPGDFDVLIDGRPQKITNFSYVRVTPEAAPQPAQEKAQGKRLPGPEAMRLPPQPVVRREQVRRTIVLMVDDLGLSFESVAFVRRALHKFVEQQMQPGDLVAVCRTAAGSGALQTFTTDRGILLSVVDHLRWYPDGRGGIGMDQARVLATVVNGRSAAPGGASGRSAFENPFPFGSSVGTLVSVLHVVDALRDMPGRKSVVLFSDGIAMWIPPQPDHPGRFGVSGDDNSGALDATGPLKALTDRANRSGTVIYAMDVRGLQSLTMDASYNLNDILAHQLPHQETADATQVIASAARDMAQDHAISQAGLRAVAELTGGFISTGNDLNYGLDRVLEDQNGYYLLGFHPNDSVFAPAGGVLRFNRVKVRVHGAGLHVRSRTGFYGQTDEQERPKNPTALDQLRASMVSPFRSSEIHVRATPLYSQLTKQGPLVRNLIYIDVRDLQFEPQLDGSSKAYLDLLGVAVGAGDRPLGAVAKPYVVLVPRGGMERARENGVVYSLDLAVAHPGPYQFRMAVRDQKTGKLGSASQFLEIPDLQRARLVLTSVVLGKSGIGNENERLARLVPARRLFRQDDVLEYFCLLEESAKPRAATAGALDARIRIFHDDKEVYSGPAPLTRTEAGQPAVFGRLQLKNTIQPGEYYIQVVARLPQGKKEIVASQWTDFEVID